MCVVLVLFFSLSAVMWPSPPQPSTQNRACNWVWVCLLSPLFDGKGWIGEGIKRMLCPPHLHAAAPPAYLPRGESYQWPEEFVVYFASASDPAVPVGWRHDSTEVMKHILRGRGGLKAAETKHAGSRLAMQAGGWQSFNPHHSADKSACEFHFYPLTSLLGSWVMNKPPLAFEAFWCNIQPWIMASAPGQRRAEALGKQVDGLRVQLAHGQTEQQDLWGEDSEPVRKLH